MIIPGKIDKERQRRTWTDDLKDGTDIKAFYTWKRTAEDRERLRFMVSNLLFKDGAK